MQTPARVKTRDAIISRDVESLTPQLPGALAQQTSAITNPASSHQSETGQTTRPKLQAALQNLSCCSSLSSLSTTDDGKGPAEAGRVASMKFSAIAFFLLDTTHKLIGEFSAKQQKTETRLI